MSAASASRSRRVVFVARPADQMARHRAARHLTEIGDQIVLLPFFNLTYTENHGISLGLLNADSRHQPLAAGRDDRRDRRRGRLLDRAREAARSTSSRSAWCSAARSAISSTASRFGYVVDFADLHFGEFRPFLVFNVADAAISIGVVILLLRAFLARKDKAPKETIEHA